MINAPLAIGISLAGVIADRTIIGKVLGSAYSVKSSSRLEKTAFQAAIVPVLLVLGSVVAGLISHFALGRFNAEYLDGIVFIITILGMTLVAEALAAAQGKPGSLNRMLSGAAAVSILLGLASMGADEHFSAGAALSVGAWYFLFFFAYCGIREKLTLGKREKGFLFSRELVIAGLLALVVIGSIVSLHH